MRISDWSSDVCSSDLTSSAWPRASCASTGRRDEGRAACGAHRPRAGAPSPRRPVRRHPGRALAEVDAAVRADRKSVVSGKSVSVRVDLGGRRIIKQKTKTSDKYKTLTEHIHT